VLEFAKPHAQTAVQKSRDRFACQSRRSSSELKAFNTLSARFGLWSSNEYIVGRTHFDKSTASDQQPSHQYSASQTTRCASSTPPYRRAQSRTASQAKARVSSFRAARCSCRCRFLSRLRTVEAKKVSYRCASFRFGGRVRQTASKLCSIVDSCIGSTSQRSGRKDCTSTPQMEASLWITQALTPTTV
jgi:hypothetical protein